MAYVPNQEDEKWSGVIEGKLSTPLAGDYAQAYDKLYRQEIDDRFSVLSAHSFYDPYGQGTEDPKKVLAQRTAWNKAMSSGPAKATGRVFSWLGDILSRVNYASANTAMDLFNGGGFNPVTSIYDGITGKKKTTYSDVLSEHGMNNYAASLLGLGLDIALDPTTYAELAGGPGGWVGLASSIGSKIDRLADVTKAFVKADKFLDVEKGLANMAKLDNLVFTKKGAFELEEIVRDVKKTGVSTLEAGEIARKKFVEKFVAPHIDPKTGELGNDIFKVLTKPGLVADIPFLPSKIGSFVVPGGTWQKTLLTADKLGKPLSEMTTKLGNWFGAVKTATLEAHAANKPAGWIGEAILLSDKALEFTKKALIYRYGQSAGVKMADTAKNIALSLSRQQAVDMGNALVKLGPDVQSTVFRVLTGEAKLSELPTSAQPIVAQVRATIDALGSELVKVGLLKEDVYRQGVGNYLPVLYKAFETDPDIARFVGKFKDAFGVKMPKGAMGRLAARGSLEDLGRAELKYRGFKLVGKEWQKGKEVAKYTKAQLVELGKEFQSRTGKIETPAYLVARALTDMHALLEEKKAIQYIKQFSAKTLREASKLVREGKWERVGKEFKDKAGNIYKIVGSGSAADKTKYQELAGSVLSAADHELVTGGFIKDILDNKNFTKWWDKMLNFWKAGKTVWNPGMLSRNFMNNFALNDLGGVSLTKNWSQYQRAMKTLVGKGSKMDEELLAQAKKFGIFTGEFIDSDLQKMFLEALNVSDNPIGFMKKVAVGIKKLGTKGSDIMRFTEEWGKLTHVMAKLDRGLPMTEAVASAHKYLINYQELTNIERGIIKRFFMPFYTYPRKVLPVVLEAAITNPRSISKYAKVAKAVESLSRGEEDRERYMPDWMKKRFMVRMPFKDTEGNLLYFDMAYILPFGDTESFNLDPIENLNPIIKEFLAQKFNKDLFTKSTIVPEGTPMFGTGGNVAKRVLHAGRTIAPTAAESAFNLGEAATGRKRFSGSGVETFPLQMALSKLLGLKFQPLREDEVVPGTFGKYNAQINASYNYIRNMSSNPSYSDDMKQEMINRALNDIKKFQEDFAKK